MDDSMYLPGETSIEPLNERTALDPDPAGSRLLEELKHSIRVHLVIMGGPTPQLAVFLVKIIDFLEDEDKTRKDCEMAQLAYSIVEAAALHVQQSIDARSIQAARMNEQFPSFIRTKGDNILVAIGKSRGLPDKLAAKAAVLREMAEALRALGMYTKARYPELTDCAGNIL